MCGLAPLFERREERCLSFALKCIKHPKNVRLFPLNPNLSRQNVDIREREVFTVNYAKTEAYKKSTIPHCQRLLNAHFTKSD